PLSLVAVLINTGQAAAAPAKPTKPAAAQTANPQTSPAAKKPPAAKATSKTPPKKAPPAKPAPPVAVLPPASEEQRNAAALVFYGNHDCEFNRALQVVANPANEGYVDVHFGKQSWVMRPVLSSTGARRLEDVQGRMLLLQIAFKSMLMDVQAGIRVADECVHELHRVAMREADTVAAATGSVRGAAGTLLSGAQGAEATLRVRLMQTTDLHMNLLGWDYYQDKAVEDYGLDRTATLIKAARAEVRNSMLFDNGDLLQGNPLGDYVSRVNPLPAGEMHPAHRVMKALGYDAANLGNHEFNYGLPFLQQVLAQAPFPYVNANVVTDTTPTAYAFAPYVVLTRNFVDEAGQQQRLKVGVIGMTPPQIMQWDRHHLAGKVGVRDIVQTARELVPRMKAEGADLVVILAHSGFERGETVALGTNTVARLAEVPDVNAVLFGHSHGEFPGRFFSTHPKVDLARGTINDVPATMPGFWGSHLGVIDITLQRSGGTWKPLDGRAELRPIYDRVARKPLVDADPDVARLIAAEHQGTLTYLRSEIAQTTAPIHSYFAQVADDASVQLVSQAQLAYARKALEGTPHAALPLLSAAAPLKTGGPAGPTHYTDIAAGPVAVRNVADLYVYPNTVQVVKLSGAQVREWLEMSAGAFNRIDPAGPPEQTIINTTIPGYYFDTLDGVTYRIDLTQPARYDRNGRLVAGEARRIVDLRFNGQPIDDAAEFAVVTNNYRASGGGNFPGLDGSNVILETVDESRQVLLQYLQATKKVEPTADNNWSVLPVRGVKLRFTSGAGGIAHLAPNPTRHPQIVLVKDNGDGSAVYELKP
ncbi:MAG TPA: bifunctional 2',3'-cyclic-nucleotide 2'-phosphodiesterase/3'-nucleotidase, partial [Rubrivivax sp.]|nr:bifunctional 2',3'-cyclic-nucleotide 2'-phosphodiesterase/3'-nucleotidase [Rubrivivax sp.]